MRVGIYNRWLSTLGGGEKHSLEIAAWFARSHQVEYLNHGGVDATRISDTLAVDVSNIDFRSIPELPSLGLSPISRDYDVFINASFMDFFPSLAPLNAAVIYFPPN